jgi:uncharacterized membrane protein YbhN (UPF0104 family)
MTSDGDESTSNDTTPDDTTPDDTASVELTPTGAASPVADRRMWIRLAYAAFVVAVVTFGIIGLRGRWGEIGEAITALAVWRWFAAGALVTSGLGFTSLVWYRLMRCHGAPIPRRPALVVFFVGQLGKYIPGSLWSMGAQAEMARHHDTPARVTVSAGLLFVGVNVASAGSLGSLGALLGGLDTRVPAAAFVVAAIAGPVVLSPMTLNAIGRRLAPSSHPLRSTWSDIAVIGALMCASWLVYGAALLTLVEPPLGDAASGDLSLLTTMAVFSLAYAVGVLVIIAPAGVGAREATMVALLTPYIGVERAVASALVIRVLHTAADFAVALVSWWVGRRSSPGVATTRH